MEARDDAAEVLKQLQQVLARVQSLEDEVVRVKVQVEDNKSGVEEASAAQEQINYRGSRWPWLRLCCSRHRRGPSYRGWRRPALRASEFF